MRDDVEGIDGGPWRVISGQRCQGCGRSGEAGEDWNGTDIED